MNEIEKAIETLITEKKRQYDLLDAIPPRSRDRAIDICNMIKACEFAIAALEAQKADRWIPCEERLPELEYIKNIWVTARKKGYDHRIVMRIRWDYRRFQHPNGKEISDTWEILAWKLTEYPEPYDPLAEKIQAALDREHERISGGKSK